MTYGEFNKMLRLASGLSQRAFAESVGIKQSAVARLERMPEPLDPQLPLDVMRHVILVALEYEIARREAEAAPAPDAPQRGRRPVRGRTRTV